MAFRVQDFRSALLRDGARPNLFECTLAFPARQTAGPNVGLGGALTDTNDISTKYTFMARAAQLPGSTVNQIPVNYFGRELKFAGNRTFPEWTVTIINDEDFKIRNAFETWMNRINGHVRNTRDFTGIEGADGYQKDGMIKQYGKDGKVIKIYNFIGMFPIDLSPIEVDWGANDAIEEYSVTFAYQWWESDTTDYTSSSVFATNSRSPGQ